MAIMVTGAIEMAAHSVGATAVGGDNGQCTDFVGLVHYVLGALIAYNTYMHKTLDRRIRNGGE